MSEISMGDPVLPAPARAAVTAKEIANAIAHWPILLFASMALLLAVTADLAGRRLAPGGLAPSAIVGLASMVALAGGFAATRRRRRPDAASDRVRALDAASLSETARCLLLGRIADSISHEIGQSLNVIVMANGNLAYVLDRADLPEPDATQLRERARKIATHSDAAAQLLAQLRWFGRDGVRDGGETTVGTALKRAIGVTAAAARRRGVAVEIQGDAVSQPVPLRHGMIEMMATAALLEMLQHFAERAAESAPLRPVIVEATRTQRSIEISLLTRSADWRHAAHDDVGCAIHDVVGRLAAGSGGEWRRVSRDGDPVRHLLRFDRDIL